MGARREKKKEYQVVSLNVNGISKIFVNGEIVSNLDFPEGHAEKLAEEGHLKEKEAKAENSKKPAPSTGKTAKNTGSKTAKGKQS
jgi:hypothetical protein